MRLEELDYEFPRELIAQHPVEPRDSCRLMVVARSGSVRHQVFSDLPGLLSAGDVLVLNDSRVLKARLLTRRETGGEVELLFLRPLNGGGIWEVLARPSRRLRIGSSLRPLGGGGLELLENLGEGRWAVRSTTASQPILQVLDAQGLVPLPPYIGGTGVMPETYQTVYAAEPGSAAAPTAGLHFTPDLLGRLRRARVEVAFVTLHVGLDTFRPISTPLVEEHAIHTEVYSVSPDAVQAFNLARVEGRRLIAVGTTSARVLETIYRDGEAGGKGSPGRREGATNLFITPGHRFQAVDGLITNFHLPRTSLLALVMAFAGVDTIRAAYAEAVAHRYRFFSFGDAMLLEGSPSGRPRAGVESRVA
ncbi:MAG: tRNA preQ1(34) S-adenosylmethionine ribosyltransferase-isomerase QueA [Gaiellales bacterium]|nr:tRNA preQ1(34) S-adenosylmethionine ribosyltransferase-isomerase QueA [Gaiellales bacterium]